MLGGLKKVIRVKVDPNLLSRYGVTAIEVAESLKT